MKLFPNKIKMQVNLIILKFVLYRWIIMFISIIKNSILKYKVKNRFFSKEMLQQFKICKNKKLT